MRRLVVVSILLAACASVHMERGALQPPDLAGPWIGLASDSTTYYRLILTEHETGLCATNAGKQTNLYRVRSWTLQPDSGITIHLELAERGSLTGAPTRFVLHGDHTTSRLRLAGEAHRVTLWREEPLLASRDRLRKAMED